MYFLTTRGQEEVDAKVGRALLPFLTKVITVVHKTIEGVFNKWI